MKLRTQPLTAEAFRIFGDVIETAGVTAESINQGNTRKFADLAKMTATDGGRVQISIYSSNAIELPFRIRMMERHPYGSQAFYPLHDRPFPIVVAPPDTVPGPDTVRAFLSNGRQGVNIHPDVWHHYQLSMAETSEYLVIDRAGPGVNCDEYLLEQEVILVNI